MKKMVCEICGSQSIRKENGVFICQECGTEYCAEDAKKLLIDVDIITPENDLGKVNKITEEEDKFLLLKKLSLWGDFLSQIQKIIPKYYSVENLYGGSLRLVESFDILRPSFEFNIFAGVDNPQSSFVVENEFFKKQMVNEPLYVELKGIWLKSVNLINEKLKSGYKQCHPIDGGDFIATENVLNYRYFGPGIDFLLRMRYSKFHDFLFSLINEKKTLQITYGKVGIFVFHEMLSDFPSLIDAQRKAKKLNNKLLDDYYGFFESNDYLDYKAGKENMLKELISEVPSLEDIFYLPIQYRNVESVVGLMKIILDGKAESWKEAVILFDTESFRKNLLQSISNLVETLNAYMENINTQLEKINLNLQNVNSKLFDISINLDKTYQKISKQNRKLQKIQRNTFITMIECL